MRSTIAMILGLAGLCLGAVVGCDDAATNGGCTESRECELPLSCIEGTCQIQCRITPDCPRGEQCIDNVCWAPTSACSAEFECEPFGKTCDLVLGQCVQPGAALCHERLNPCPGSEVCVGGACRFPTDDAGRRPDPDAGPVEPDGARPQPDASRPQPDAAQPRPDAAQPQPDAAVGGALQYGDECSCGADCESGWCVSNKLRNTRTCTDTCEGGDATCPGLDTCFDVRVSGGGQCPVPPNAVEVGTIVPVCIPNETGLACVDATRCSSGLCINPPAAPVGLPAAHGVCSVECVVGDGKCPDGYACKVSANGVQACLPANDVAACPGDPFVCGGTCPLVQGDAELAVTLCIGDEAGGFCSCSCRNAGDCPVGFACAANENSGDPNRPNVCVPIAGLVCPNADPNLLSEECFTGLCLITENPLSNRCTAICDDDTDCPEQHLCADVGAGPKLCVPLQWSEDL